MKKKIIFAIIVIVILGIVAAIASQNSAVEVNAEEVIKGNISSYVEEIGEVKTKDYEIGRASLEKCRSRWSPYH